MGSMNTSLPRKDVYKAKDKFDMEYNFAELIKEYLDTPSARELEQVLRNILTGHKIDVDMYIWHALDTLDTEEKQNKMLGYIRKWNIKTVPDIIEIETCIDEGSEPEFIG